MATKPAKSVGILQVRLLAELGQAVRAKRKASGMRIDDAAAFCGVSVDLLSRLENGRSGVSTLSLLKVLDALGLALLVADKAKLPRLEAVLNPPAGNVAPS